eukprot:COSAG05_NODE_1534_length_4616_cov_6.656409_4_plen_191_part_00
MYCSLLLYVCDSFARKCMNGRKSDASTCFFDGSAMPTWLTGLNDAAVAITPPVRKSLPFAIYFYCAHSAWISPLVVCIGLHSVLPYQVPVQFCMSTPMQVPPPLPFLSWMPLPYPWGIQVEYMHSHVCGRVQLLHSMSVPTVTNFRASNDYYYGGSYKLGTSSLLIWAAGQVPPPSPYLSWLPLPYLGGI